MSIRIDKPWGYEEIWAKTETYIGKILFIHAGHRLSLQHHIYKEENIRLIKGQLLFLLENENGQLKSNILEPGDTAHIPPGRKHRMEAIDDCEIVEVSTTQLTDIVRHEDDYGRVQPLDNAPQN
jgi:mannose-6-phosphate isomerase